MHPATPRCLHPVAFRNVNTPRSDFAPVCWRPAGHPNPERHLSRYAYLNELARSRMQRAMYKRRRQARPAEMSDLGLNVAA